MSSATKKFDSRRIRLGMVGGGQGAFIGAVHRIAARLDDRYELVAGALSSDPARAAASATLLGIAPERSYASFEDMAATEAGREDGIEAVAIVTPTICILPRQGLSRSRHPRHLRQAGDRDAGRSEGTGRDRQSLG